MSRISVKRLQREIADLKANGCPAGCDILRADDLAEWVITLQVLGETVYPNEIFALRFRFSPAYPIESPEVVFLTTEGYTAPEHPHVYSNGHICASILGSGWSPVLNTSSICLTLQSMLASCKKKERPKDNDQYVRTAPLSPKQTRFVYHDDAV